MRKLRTTAIAVAIAVLLSPLATPAAQATTGDSSTDAYALFSSENEIVTNLDTIGWPGQDSNDFYPGVLGHPDGPSSATWGTPGAGTSYQVQAKCASFLTLSLQHTYAWATNDWFSQYFGSGSPFAQDYYSTFTGTNIPPQFTRIGNVASLYQGAIIAIKYTDDTGATGHVMVVAGAPQLYNRDGNPATTEYAIPVLDSTDTPHGVATTYPNSTYWKFPDTRISSLSSNPPTTEYSGAGEGHIFIQVDSSGAPAGYWWGPNENVTSEFHPVSQRPIAMAGGTH
jgi:hypothetical protein